MGKREPESDSESEYEEVTDSESEYETDSDDEAEVVVKEKSPCKHYRVNVKGAKFGDCFCGWPKDAHTAKGTNKAKQALDKLKSDKSSNIGPTDGPCKNFRVDTNAAEFGTCKCGYKQRDHQEEKINPARAALKSLRSRNAGKGSTNNVASSDGPCNNYVVNVNGKNFGDCVCGHSKASHQAKDEDFAAKALKNLKAKNSKKNEEMDRLANGLAAIDDTPSGKKKGKTKALDSPSSDGGAPSTKACCIVM